MSIYLSRRQIIITTDGSYIGMKLIEEYDGGFLLLLAYCDTIT